MNMLPRWATKPSNNRKLLIIQCRRKCIRWTKIWLHSHSTDQNNLEHHSQKVLTFLPATMKQLKRIPFNWVWSHSRLGWPLLSTRAASSSSRWRWMRARIMVITKSTKRLTNVWVMLVSRACRCANRPSKMKKTTFSRIVLHQWVRLLPNNACNKKVAINQQP